MQAYADDLAVAERQARALRGQPGGPPDSPERRAELDALRACVARNVDRECVALDLMANELEARQAQEIDGRVAALLVGDVDLSERPDELSARVAACHAAATDTERAASENELRDFVRGAVTREITALRTRAERLRADTPAETSRRVEQLLARRHK